MKNLAHENILSERLNTLFRINSLEFDSRKENIFSTELLKNKYFNFYLTNAAAKWINIYKDVETEKIKNSYELAKQKNTNITFSHFSILNYLHNWIFLDFFELLSYLPENLYSYINIGAGIGFLDIIFKQMYGPELYGYLIEKDFYYEENELLKEKRVLKERLSPITLIKENISNYNFENLSFLSPNDLLSRTDYKDPINLIISIRSWCFLYDIDYYYEKLKSIANESTLIITDVSIDRTEEFKVKFIPLKQIKTFKYYTRVLAKFKY